MAPDAHILINTSVRGIPSGDFGGSNAPNRGNATTLKEETLERNVESKCKRSSAAKKGVQGEPKSSNSRKTRGALSKF